MADARPTRIDVARTISESFGFVRGAVAPTILGTTFYALTALVTALIINYQLFGSYGVAGSACLYGLVGLSWFSMALRRGTGQADKGIFGMSFGLDEIRLGLSTAAVVIALGLVGFFIGFALFLVSMSTVLIDSGQLGNEEALTAYLDSFTLEDAGLAARVVILATTMLALSGFLYLLVRVLPYAPGSIARRKVTALESVVWTKYQGRPLLISFLGSAGIAIAIVVAGQYVLMQTPLPAIATGTLGHFLGCFGALALVGFSTSAYRQLASEPHSSTE